MQAYDDGPTPSHPSPKHPAETRAACRPLPRRPAAPNAAAAPLLRCAGLCKYGCTHPVRSCGELRVFSERSNRWETLCPSCTVVKSAYASAARKAAAEVKKGGGGGSTPSPASVAVPSLHSICGYAGVTPEEAAFVPRLLAAVKSDPVLMAAWDSVKDDLFSEYVLLCCRRRTNSDSLAKNLSAMHEHLRARINLNFCEVRDDIVQNDRSIMELPMCACVP